MVSPGQLDFLNKVSAITSTVSYAVMLFIISLTATIAFFLTGHVILGALFAMEVVLSVFSIKRKLKGRK